VKRQATVFLVVLSAIAMIAGASVGFGGLILVEIGQLPDDQVLAHQLLYARYVRMTLALGSHAIYNWI